MDVKLDVTEDARPVVFEAPGFPGFRSMADAFHATAYACHATAVQHLAKAKATQQACACQANVRHEPEGERHLLQALPFQAYAHDPRV